MSTPPTSPFGMGFCPLGFSLFGYGSPATAATQSGRTLEQVPNGASRDARFIDPYSRDYIIDANGLLAGQSAIQQQVFLAIMTTMGTAANPNVGSQFSHLRTFNPATFQSQINSYVQQALANLIKTGVISLVGVVASLNSNGVCGNVTVNWIDNTTRQTNQTTVTP